MDMIFGRFERKLCLSPIAESFAKFETKFAGVSQKRKFREICGALAARSAEKMGGSNLEEKVADSARKSLILVRF